MGFTTSAKTTTTIVNNFDSITESGKYRQKSNALATGRPTNDDDLILTHEEYEDPADATGNRLIARQEAYSTTTARYWHRHREADGTWTSWIPHNSQDGTDDRYGKWNLIMADTDPDNGTADRYYNLPGISGSEIRLQVKESNAGITINVMKHSGNTWNITTRAMQTDGTNRSSSESFGTYNEMSSASNNPVGFINNMELGREAFGEIYISSSSSILYYYQIILKMNVSGRYILYLKRET